MWTRVKVRAGLCRKYHLSYYGQNWSRGHFARTKSVVVPGAVPPGQHWQSKRYISKFWDVLCVFWSILMFGQWAKPSFAKFEYDKWLTGIFTYLSTTCLKCLLLLSKFIPEKSALNSHIPNMIIHKRKIIAWKPVKVLKIVMHCFVESRYRPRVETIIVNFSSKLSENAVSSSK